MNPRLALRNHAGYGLAEVLVSLVLLGIVGIGLTRTLISQTRFADMEHKQSGARNVARSPVNLLLSEGRMVENGNGVAAAISASGASSVTLRVPVSMGLVCGASGAGTAVSMMPTDSVALAGAALSGYAYRASSGAYDYTETPITLSSAGAAVCTAAQITTVPGGRVVTITPAFPAAATAGLPAFIYQRVRYSFAASTSISGRLALWRTLEATNTAEELAAPYDTSSRFRFFRNNNDTSDVTVPALTEINGIELVLVGASEKGRFGRSTPETATVRTAVFFSNRTN